MTDDLKKPVTYVKGVGPKRAEMLSKLGIKTAYDLLYHFPRNYIDFNEQVNIHDAQSGETYAVKVRVVKKMFPTHIRKGLTVFKAIMTDDTADLTLVIYNSEYVFSQLCEGKEYILYGKITGSSLRKEMSSPIIIPEDCPDKIQPSYHLTEGLTQTIIRQSIHNALTGFNKQIYEPLPKKIQQENNLCSLDYALENIHFPKDNHSLQTAKRRLVFDELFILRLGMNILRNRSLSKTGCIMKETDMSEFYRLLPFEPTKCQERCITECCTDMKKNYPMSRLIQGDVGSGKTVVAAGAAFFVSQNGYQTALMVPTEILAIQHFKTFESILSPLGIKVCLLTGSLSAKAKSQLKEKISEGEYQIIIGTHALIQGSTEFHNLGLVITDEQHRFGVEQREGLALKGENPHKLVMSATPIPRTLAMMIYGDLDLSVLDELPKGRQHTETYAISGKIRERAYSFVRERLDEGRQAYIVCPMIDENDMDLKSAKKYAKKISEDEFKNYSVGLLHGKMSATEKDEVMNSFKNKEIDILVSTTVIEVGVDVPNAVVMLIENADRFGLSQLHQLRGRVGRGNYSSYCILVTDNVTEDVRKRLRFFSSESDGFKISEEDLRIRGAGDFFGSRQHGLPKLKIADMSSDTELFYAAKRSADKITKTDPMLTKSENKGLRELAMKLFEKGCSG